MENKEQDGFDSGRGSSSNPIQLPEVIVYGKRPLPWYKRAFNGVAKFVNDEIFLNKDNIRVKTARRHPRAMDAMQEGGNIAGAIVAAPFAAYTAVQAAPVVMPALKVAGQAVTPSTWIGGVAQATGYQAPAWLLNGADLAASAYYANEAGKDIDKNGLTWKTGFNALMSLAPMTRETEAIEGVANTLRRPAQAVSSVVDDFRAARNSVSSPEAVLGREFSRSVKDTQFINIPIEHVSNKGVTEGAGLNAASSSDVGFHFSPAGSKTTSNIQRAAGAPFVRTGTWTYSNNTKPIFALDRGNWTYDFNPELYRGLNPGTTPSENALALSQRGPNYTYINNFEGQGGRSYMTTSPDFGIQLSKNTLYTKIDPIQTTGVTPVYAGYLHDIKDFYGAGISGKVGNNTVIIETDPSGKVFVSGSTIGSRKFANEQQATEYLEQLHNNYVNTLSPAEKEMYLRQNVVNEYSDTAVPSRGSSEFTSDIKQRSQDDIDMFYNSDEYTDRFNKRLSEYYDDKYDNQLTSDQLSQLKGQFDDILADIQAKYQPGMFRGEPYGFSNAQTMNLGLNANLAHSEPEIINPTITHEFGHLIWHYPWFYQPKGARFSAVNNANISLMGNPVEHLTSIGRKLPQDRIDYITDHNELRQRVIPIVKEAMQNGWTPEEAYQKSKLVRNSNLDQIFDKDYIIKLIGGMLSVSPLIQNKDEHST